MSLVRIELSINAYEAWIGSAAEFRRKLSYFVSEQFRELHLSIGSDRTPWLMALLNGDRGWLMYRRDLDDAGLRSFNPDFRAEQTSMREYRLSNGQIDEYPESWALPEDTVIRALEYFIDHRQPAPFVDWYDERAALEGRC